MNPLTIAMGVACLGFGCWTMVLRQKNSSKLSKLQAMKNAWGDTPGYMIHLLSYSIGPMLFGLGMILLGVRGMSVMDFFAQ